MFPMPPASASQEFQRGNEREANMIFEIAAGPDLIYWLAQLLKLTLFAVKFAACREGACLKLETLL